MSDENNYRKKKSVTERGVGRSNALSALALPDPLQCGLTIVGSIVHVMMLTGIGNITIVVRTVKADSFQGGTVSGTTGTFTGVVSGTTGTFTGDVSATTGAFTGDVSAATGTFTGGVSAATATVDNFIINDGGTIGSASDPDAISIAAGGEVTLTKNLEGTTASFSGLVTTTFDVGEVAPGWTASESAIGKLHVVTLATHGGFACVYSCPPDNAAAAFGLAPVYLFPSGGLTVIAASIKVGLKSGSTELRADTPEVGLGTTIGSGANATLATAMENIMVGQTAVGCNDQFLTKTVNDTILRIADGDERVVWLNIANTWSNNTSTNVNVDITAGSSITLVYLVD